MPEVIPTLDSSEDFESSSGAVNFIISKIQGSLNENGVAILAYNNKEVVGDEQFSHEIKVEEEPLETSANKTQIVSDQVLTDDHNNKLSDVYLKEKTQKAESISKDENEKHTLENSIKDSNAETGKQISNKYFENNYSCPFCSKSYTYYSSLRRHFTDHCGRGKNIYQYLNSRFKCAICGMISSQDFPIIYHCKKEHQEKVVPYNNDNEKILKHLVIKLDDTQEQDEDCHSDKDREDEETERVSETQKLFTKNPMVAESSNSLNESVLFLKRTEDSYQCFNCSTVYERYSKLRHHILYKCTGQRDGKFQKLIEPNAKRSCVKKSLAKQSEDKSEDKNYDKSEDESEDKSGDESEDESEDISEDGGEDESEAESEDESEDEYNKPVKKRSKKPFPQKYQCPQCSKYYTYYTTFLRHIKSDCGTKRHFNCDICRTSFVVDADLRNHLLTASHNAKEKEKKETRISNAEIGSYSGQFEAWLNS